jgi:hypothetical protein
MTYITDWRTWKLDIVCMEHKYLICFRKANIKEDILTNAVQGRTEYKKNNEMQQLIKEKIL